MLITRYYKLELLYLSKKRERKGMSLKDFKIISKLGEGAYSIVYKVTRESDNQIYALKKVKLANLSQKQIQNAVNEVRILASLKNRNVVGYKQVFLDDNNLCIIMQFLDDGDLYQKILTHKKQNYLLQEKQIWNIVIQISHGLKSLHDLSILHRDLKSSNIFLSKEGVAKLGDMNVSKIAKNGLLYTQTGTPYYASPQVWKDQPYDTKSDVWSFGCVIYQMTNLQPPFQAEDMEGLYKSVISGKYKQINSCYSKQLAYLIKLMLQLKPKLRPSIQKILNSNLLQKKKSEYFLTIQQSLSPFKQQLLRTIKIPKNLHYLIDQLPKANYQQFHNCIYTTNNSPQPNKKNFKSLQKINSSLPKLVNMVTIIKNGNTRKGRGKKKQFVIEGRSKIISQARIQYRNYNIDQEIKRQLKRMFIAD